MENRMADIKNAEQNHKKSMVFKNSLETIN
jgi:hypothetical protein